MQELDNDRLVWMFTQMLRIREFEERVKRTFEEHPGAIRGASPRRSATRPGGGASPVIRVNCRPTCASRTSRIT